MNLFLISSSGSEDMLVQNLKVVGPEVLSCIHFYTLITYFILLGFSTYALMAIYLKPVLRNSYIVIRISLVIPLLKSHWNLPFPQVSNKDTFYGNMI